MNPARATRLFGPIAVLAVVAATAVGAQDTTHATPRPTHVAPHRNRLLGAFDEDSGEPIEGLEVIDVLSGTTALTTKTGTVSLAFLAEGTSLLRLRKVGYSPVTMNVAISAADTAPVTVVMRRNAQELPAVVTKDSARRWISPGLQGFEERMRAGFGHFIDDSTLRKMEGEPMSNALRRFAGGMLRNGRFVSARSPNAGPALGSKATGGTCAVAVYENGVRLTSPPNFDRVNVDDYAGVEFYAGAETYPVWISPTNNSCGILLLWLREK
jgi:hypothetical protein